MVIACTAGRHCRYDVPVVAAVFPLMHTHPATCACHMHLHTVDATCGNGHDTVELARLVGPAGQVFAFDIQADALHSAQQLLDEQDSDALCRNVRFVQACHSTMQVCQACKAQCLGCPAHLPVPPCAHPWLPLHTRCTPHPPT